MTSSFVRDIPANILTVDPRVQRVMDPNRVGKIAGNWNDLMVGVLTVSHREASPWQATSEPDPNITSPLGEQFVVLDGQTRLGAFRQVCGADTVATLRAEVFEGLTLKEEASMFLEHNDRKAITPLDRYRIALVAGEEWAETIYDTASGTGWFAQGTDPYEGYDGKVRRFTAIAAVEKIYRADTGPDAVLGTALKQVFDAIGNAWPKEPGTVTTETLNGLGLVFARHPGLDRSGLTHKLGRIGYYKYVSGIHDTRRGNTGMSIAAAAYRHTLDVYNHGRRSRRIEA